MSAQGPNLRGREKGAVRCESVVEGGGPPLSFLRGKGFHLTMIADSDQRLINAERKAFDLRL